MERTIGIVIFTVIAVIIAAILLLFVRKSLQLPYSTGVNLTQDERGLFTLPPCDEQACELTDQSIDCTAPVCVNGTCVQAAKNVTRGRYCTTFEGVEGTCDGAGSCIPCADGRDNATVCGGRVCGTARDSCGVARECGACASGVCTASGTCQTCPADDATYTTSRYITDVCSYPAVKDNVHANMALSFATVRLGGERYLIYGWPNSVAVFNITTPMQASWMALPIQTNDIWDNYNQPQPLSLPTQLDGQDNPPGFLWIVNGTIRSCAYDYDTHALISDHLEGYATLDGFPYVYVNRGDWGWDILSIGPPVHLLHAGPSPGTHRFSPSECELTGTGGGGSGVLFRNKGSVYLAIGDKVYLLSAVDGSVTPETFKWKTTAPVGKLPVGLAAQTLFTMNAVYEHVGQQYLFLSNGNSIAVVNVSSPSSPSLVAEWAPPSVKGQRYAVDVQRSVLYRIADDGFVLYAYNISDFKNPVLLSTTVWSTATGTPFLPTLSLSGDLLVASASDNVGIINVKDPAHPILLRSQPGITSITPRKCNSGERGTPDVLAFQQDGGYYFARIRLSDGDIVKVESCQFQGVSAGPCVRFETTYFNTSNDPDCKYPVNKSKPYDCSLNNDPWIPRDYGGEVWTLGGKRFLIDANGGYYMRAFTLDNPARPVRIAYARLFTDQIWTLRVMYPFGGFSVLDDDPIGYARYGVHGYVIFKFVPPSVTRLYQYDLWPSGDYFMNGKLVKVGGVRYLVGLLSTNEQSTTKWSTTSAWAGSDTLSGISIYRLGDDGMPRPLAFLEYHWLRVSPFWVYQAPDGDPFLYTYPTDIYGNPLPGNGLAAWNLSDPSNPTGPILLHDQNGQPFTNYRFVFDEAERKAYAFIANGTQYSIVAYDWSNPVSPKRLGEFNFTVYNSSIEYFSSLSARDGLVYINFFTNYASPSFSVSALLVSFADPAHPKAIPDQDGVLRSLAYNGGGSDILHDAATGRYYVYRSNSRTADVISVDEACVANPSG